MDLTAGVSNAMLSSTLLPLETSPNQLPRRPSQRLETKTNKLLKKESTVLFNSEQIPLEKERQVIQTPTMKTKKYFT